ncbi:MAG: hypothetical protein NTY64_17600 [Deltaproteobacteria bacterium]|nr:hypothetical protein [Deltaproteobacteria bacterium]
MKGYAGKILRVDLSKKRAEAVNLDASLAKSFIGGAGWGRRSFLMKPDRVPIRWARKTGSSS